jgi:hypothetical protein
MSADISGRLDVLSFVEILGLLREKKSTGRLLIAPRGSGEYEFFLADGDLVLAQNVEEPWLERVMERYEADREMVMTGASLHGDWLRSLSMLGFLSEDEVQRRLTDQCVSIGIGAAAQEEGAFDYYSGVECDLSEFKVDVFYLQLEVARRLDELKRSLPPELGERGRNIRVLKDPWEIQKSLSLDEWRLIHAIALKGEGATLGGVWEDQLFESTEAYSKTLKRLVEAGVVEVVQSERKSALPSSPTGSEVDSGASMPQPTHATTESPAVNDMPASERSTAAVSPALIASVSALRPSEIEVHSEFQLVELREGKKHNYYAIQDRTTVGRSEESDICLSHESISRRHAIFAEAGKAVHLQVVAKSNPALVNGQRFVSGWLKGGEVIVFYPYCFLLEGKAEVRRKE